MSSGSSSPSSFSSGRSRSAAQPARECSVQPCTSVSVPFVLTVSLLRVTLLSCPLLLSPPGSWGGIVARRSPVVRLAICLPSFPVWRDLLERREPTRGSHHRVPPPSRSRVVSSSFRLPGICFVPPYALTSSSSMCREVFLLRGGCRPVVFRGISPSIPYQLSDQLPSSRFFDFSYLRNSPQRFP